MTAVRSTRGRWGRLPWVVAVADIAVFIFAVVVSGATDLSFAMVFGSAIASMVLVGALLLTRAAGNKVGPLLLIAGTIQSINVILGGYAMKSLGRPGGPWPGAVVATVMIQVVFTLALLAILIGVPLIFPDGHLPSRRWRFVVWLTIAGMATFAISTLFTPGPIGEGQPDNPLGIPGIEPAFQLFTAFASLGALVGFGGAVLSVAVRFRRGRGVERQQLKWFLAVAAISSIAFLAGIFLPEGQFRDIALNLALYSLIAMPIAIGIAILRYRLYEIDRLVSRTIAYAVVTGGLILVYLAINLGLTTVFSSLASGNSAVVAASTLVVAALFTPLRRRVQSIVDHRFDRARYDGERTAEAFSERLRNQVDLPAVATDLQMTVRAAIAPTSVGVWLRTNEL